MNVKIETRDSFRLHEIEALRTNLETLLKVQTTPEEQKLLLCLADNLLTYSHSQVLLKLPSAEVLDWLLAIRDFLAKRSSLVSLEWFKPGQSQADYLLVNTPDAPF